MNIPKERYKEILELMPICCIDVVIIYKGKIFMVKRTNEPAKNQWWFPGGRVLKNEKLRDAVKRKLFEETGLRGKSIKPLIFDETIFEKSSIKGINAHTINLCFSIEVDNDQVVLDNQSSEYKWVDKIEEKWHPYVKKVIEYSGIFKQNKKE